jgi:hypothetical protein
MDDLEEAIRRTEEAVEATPQGHSNLAERLNHLGNMFQSRFEQTGRIEDLDKASRMAERAVEASLKGHRDPGVLIPVAALASPTGVVWYSDSTNRSAGSNLEPVIDEIIGSSFPSAPQLLYAL